MLSLFHLFCELATINNGGHNRNGSHKLAIRLISKTDTINALALLLGEYVAAARS
jgi:hypothetical protein